MRLEDGNIMEYDELFESWNVFSKSVPQLSFIITNTIDNETQMEMYTCTAFYDSEAFYVVDGMTPIEAYLAANPSDYEDAIRFMDEQLDEIKLLASI